MAACVAAAAAVVAAAAAVVAAAAAVMECLEIVSFKDCTSERSSTMA